jgi:Domain of Unknown Function (DUF1080)
MYKLNKHCSLPKGVWMAGVLLLVLSFNACRTARNAGRKDGDGFVRVFDGASLNNWVGDTTYWRVEDSCLVGVVTPATLLKRNSFIIWQDDMPENFEIRVAFKVSAQGNSGINYRSGKIEGFPYLLRGYQADLDGAKTIPAVTMKSVSGPHLPPREKRRSYRRSLLTPTLCRPISRIINGCRR